MILKNYVIQNEDNEPIYIDFRYDQGTTNGPLVIVLHGFKGFKDWGFFPNLCERFTDAGYATLCFNFSRNGIGMDFDNFTEPDKFAENTYTHELADLKTVIDAVENGVIGKNIINTEKMAILGHSRGGAVALLSALEMPDQFQAVITWSAISNLYRYSDEEIKQWLKRGYIEVENKRTGQIMKLNKTFWNDLDRNKKKFNLESRMGKLDIPALFIHGLLDTSVPCEESQNLHEWCGAFQKRLELIEEADHTYNIRHPFNGINPVYDLCCNLSESWLDNAFLL